MKSNLVKDKLFKLMTERDKLESQINEFGLVLEANDNVGLHSELIDPEGFPRNDIDLQRVRLARHQIICLQNDHKQLTKIIEELLHQLHAEATEEQPQSLLSKTAGILLDSDSKDVQTIASLVPFVQVNSVSPSSPAEKAGVLVGDQIIEFGSINSQNFTGNLHQIATVMNHMQNKMIALKIKRETQVLNLMLTPKIWSGRGLFGCNIVVLNAVEP